MSKDTQNIDFKNEIATLAGTKIWGNSVTQFIEKEMGPHPSHNVLQEKNAVQSIDIFKSKYAILRTGYNGQYATILTKNSDEYIKMMLSKEDDIIYYN